MTLRDNSVLSVLLSQLSYMNPLAQGGFQGVRVAMAFFDIISVSLNA